MYVVTFGVCTNQNGVWSSDGSFDTDDHWFQKLSQAATYWESYDLEEMYRLDWETATVKPVNRGYYVALEEWSVDSDGEPLDHIDTLCYKTYTYEDYQVYCDLPF